MTGTRRDIALLGLLACAIGLPFLNKPFHIDDPFILMISANVLDNPLHPFAGFSSWFGRPDPVWQMATNPPLISYYLAPFAGLSDYSEIVLHAAMLPFLWLLGYSMLLLARRFTSQPWLAVLFVMTSVGVVVSGNVMRDVPTVALSTAAIAACVIGADRDDWKLGLASGVLAGLAILMKYSAAIILPLMLLYPLLRGRFRAVAYAGVTLSIVALFCLHNVWMYGETQIGLLLTRDWGPLASWQDNLAGLPVVVGSLLFLVPVLLYRGLAVGDRATRVAPLVMVGVWLATQRYLLGYADPQYLFWSMTGAALLYLCLVEALRGALPLAQDRCDEAGRDSLFLFAWICAPLIFSVAFVPFQAVRHLLPALPPVVLLAFRALERLREPAGTPAAAGERRVLVALVALQAIVAFVVGAADYEHAAAYRDFAKQTAADVRDDPGKTWYIGHWGWSFYGERAGFTQLSPDGPQPAPGDRLVQPSNYFNGVVPSGGGASGGPPRMVERGSQSYAPRIRLRPMHPVGAGFYAMYSKRERNLPSVPYRWLPPYPMETFTTYEVGR